MKKVFVFLIAVVFVVTGCSQVVIKAPPGKRILISSEPVREPDQTKRVWYILWGLVPLGDNSTMSLLAVYPDGSEVAISTERTLIDVIILAIASSLSIETRTIKVERIR